MSVVDFGAGNLLSVERALRHCGAEISLAATAEQIASADRLVLPGVGAFAACIGALRERALVEPIIEFAAGGRPFLGICVGMQMLFDASEEFGDHAGLGLIPGRVTGIPLASCDGHPLKVPHIGWNALHESRPQGWTGGILAPLAPETSVYFVHSFHGEPSEPHHRLADCCYGGHRLCAAVARDSVFGCQFHPEKSGAVGLRILAEFLAL